MERVVILAAALSINEPASSGWINHTPYPLPSTYENHNVYTSIPLDPANRLYSSTARSA